LQLLHNSSWSLLERSLKLVHTEVHIWCASLNQPLTQINKFWCTLSSEEQARANRFYFIKNRNQFIITHGLLRYILSRYLNVLPEQIRFSYTSRGKPYINITGDPGKNKFRFNISHSHNIVIYAMAWGREAGIDIEYIRSNIAYKRIAKRFFSPEELAKLLSFPPEKQNEAFFYFWTRKEAYLKAKGEGIFKGSSSVLVDTGLPSRELPHWSILSFQPESGYIGALAVEGKNYQLKFWKLGDDLRQIQQHSSRRSR